MLHYGKQWGIPSTPSVAPHEPSKIAHPSKYSAFRETRRLLWPAFQQSDRYRLKEDTQKALVKKHWADIHPCTCRPADMLPTIKAFR